MKHAECFINVILLTQKKVGYEIDGTEYFYFISPFFLSTLLSVGAID